MITRKNSLFKDLDEAKLVGEFGCCAMIFFLEMRPEKALEEFGRINYSESLVIY